MRNKVALIRKLISVFITVVLMSSFLVCFALAEQVPWDCPNCGRTGNTGHFCGNCAEPAPEQLKIQEVKMHDKGLNAEVSWTGGVRPFTLSVYHYINENHNEGIESPYKTDYKNFTIGTSDWIGILIPGQRYWIQLTDRTGREVWYDYTVPEEKTDYDVEIKTNCYTVKTIDEKGESVFIENFSAPELEKASQLNDEYSDGDHYGMNVSVHLSKAVSDRNLSQKITLFYAVMLPDGDLIPGEVYAPLFSGNDSGSKIDCLPIWKGIYSKYGRIPAGKYTFIMGIDRCVAAEKEFEIIDSQKSKSADVFSFEKLIRTFDTNCVREFYEIRDDAKKWISWTTNSAPQSLKELPLFPDFILPLYQALAESADKLYYKVEDTGSTYTVRSNIAEKLKVIPSEDYYNDPSRSDEAVLLLEQSESGSADIGDIKMLDSSDSALSFSYPEGASVRINELKYEVTYIYYNDVEEMITIDLQQPGSENQYFILDVSFRDADTSICYKLFGTEEMEIEIWDHSGAMVGTEWLNYNLKSGELVYWDMDYYETEDAQ